MSEQITNLTVRLPAYLKRQAKAEAAKVGKTLTDVITDNLRKWLAEQSQAKLPPKK